MSYCSFSKILKKHDKVTGHNTRKAFMSNVVTKTNFSNYPNLLQMISTCQTLYEIVCQFLAQEGKECLQEGGYSFLNLDVDNEEDVIASSIVHSRSSSSVSCIQVKTLSSSKTLGDKCNQRTMSEKDVCVTSGTGSHHKPPHGNTSRIKHILMRMEDDEA